MRNAPLFGTSGLVQDEKVGSLVHFESELKNGILYLNRSGMCLEPKYILKDNDSITDLTGSA